MVIKKLFLFGVFASAVVLSGSAHGQLLVNGGFETPEPAANGDTDPDGWNVIETDSISNPGRQVRTRATNPIPLTGGAAVQFGAGNSDPVGQIWQAVTVESGETYEFEIFSRTVFAGQAAEIDFLIELRDGVGIDGTVLASFSSADDFDGELTDLEWQSFTLQATATSNDLTVHITDISTTLDNNDNPGHNDGNDLIFDDASLAVAGGGGEVVGDLNGDGVTDCADIDEYIGFLGLSAVGNESLDVDASGTIDSADVEFLVENLVTTTNGQTGTALGDLSCDGSVDVLGDAFVLIGNLGNSVTSYSEGDINLDGTVNVLGDAFALIGNLGFSNEP